MLLVAPACKRGSVVTHHEYMYVSAPETSLRDRVATMYNKIGTVHNGDRVEVLEKQRRFVRVRTDGGQEGWIEERSLVPQDVYDAFQKLAKDGATQPVQAHGTTRAELNMHDTPAREGDHLYLQATGQSRLELFAEGEHDFFLEAVDAQVTFFNEGNARATKMVLHQNGSDLPGPRIE